MTLDCINCRTATADEPGGPRYVGDGRYRVGPFCRRCHEYVVAIAAPPRRAMALSGVIAPPREPTDPPPRVRVVLDALGCGQVVVGGVDIAGICSGVKIETVPGDLTRVEIRIVPELVEVELADADARRVAVALPEAG